MNNGVVVLALFCCLAGVALCGASLATTYWKVTQPVIVGIEIHEGLFGISCGLSDCTAEDIENSIARSTVEAKVAAAGVVLSALCSVIAGIILSCSMCNKSSGGAKTGATFCIFAVVFVAVGVATYIIRSLHHRNDIVGFFEDNLVPISFGYSLYLAAAAGGANVIATIAACAGA